MIDKRIFFYQNILRGFKKEGDHILNIKGLYFKLNVDKEPDKSIFEFFEENKSLGNNKIDVLAKLINIFNEMERNNEQSKY